MNDVKKEAYKIIVKVFKKNIFSDKLLQQFAKKNKENPEDTALLFHLVKGIIKYRANLDYIISKYTDSKKYQKTSIKIKALLYLAIYLS
ncbi:MAG: transcription antitermination factor NusB [Candidatus Cloacimonadota bacterium]|nr:transcription antitermination factor NusB [Candidatus Cloacimonadota bacterium]